MTNTKGNTSPSHHGSDGSIPVKAANIAQQHPQAPVGSHGTEDVVPEARPLGCSPARVVSKDLAATENNGRVFVPSRRQVTSTATSFIVHSNVAAKELTSLPQQAMKGTQLRSNNVPQFLQGVVPLSSHRLPRQKLCRSKNIRHATGLWSESEQRQFLQGLLCYGWGQWKEIGTVVCTR